MGTKPGTDTGSYPLAPGGRRRDKDPLPSVLRATPRLQAAVITQKLLLPSPVTLPPGPGRPGATVERLCKAFKN